MVESRHYSFGEQISVLLALLKIKPDVLHVPHFNIPVLWNGKLVVTIHDLIKIHSRGKESTTLPYHIYLFKWFIHVLLVKFVILKANRILVPSEYTKRDLVAFGAKENKIAITYEAASDVYFKSLENDNLLKRLKINKPYFVYTGNAYPHKNVEVLIRGIEEYNRENKDKAYLILVTARDVFVKRLLAKASENKYIHIVSQVNDSDL